MKAFLFNSGDCCHDGGVVIVVLGGGVSEVRKGAGRETRAAPRKLYRWIRRDGGMSCAGVVAHEIR